MAEKALCRRRNGSPVQHVYEEFRRTAENIGVETCAEWCPGGTGFYANAVELGQELFRSGRLPTALLSCNDVTAFAAVNTARSAGLRIPDELSVIGMDNIDMAEYFNPALTTFVFPYKEYITQVLDVLFAGAKPGCRRLQMPLKIRDSVAVFK